MDTTVLVKRVEDSYDDQVVAILRIFKEDGSLKVEVRAKNHLIRDHLTQVLESPFYQVSPINYLAEGVSAAYSLFIEPKKRLYFMYLMDRLGWYGYIISPIKTKSMEVSNGFTSISTILINFKSLLDQDSVQTVVKAVGAGGGGGCTLSGENTRVAKDNSIIVMKVPAGCIAVSREGKVIGPGKFLNAKINSPSSNWYLVPAPKNYQTHMQELASIDKKVAEQEAMASGEVTTEDENKERLQKQLEEEKKKAEKKKEIKKKAFLKLLKAKIKQGDHAAALAYYMMTGEEKEEKVDLETGHQFTISYVEVPKEKIEEFLEHFEAIKKDAKMVTVAPKGEFALEEINDNQVVLINNLEGIVALPGAMPSLVKKYVKGWRVVFPPENRRDITDEQVLREYEEAVSAIKKGEKPNLDTWTFLRGGLLKAALKEKNEEKKNSTFVKVKKHKTVRSMLEKYGLEYPDYRDSAELSVAKEFMAKIVASARSEVVDESKYTPLKAIGTDYSSSLVSGKEWKEKLVNFYKRKNELKKLFFEYKDGRLVAKPSVPEVVEDFAEILQKSGGGKIGLKWNPRISLNNPLRGGPYQLYLTKLIGNPKNYYNHPEGHPALNGFDINVEMGMGKTITTIAADALLRASHRDAYTTVVNGKKYEKFSVVLAPNPHTWVDELNKTLSLSEKDGDVLVITGSREERIQKFETLLDKLKTGSTKLPKYIIIGTGKLRNDIIEGVLEDVDDFRVSDSSIDMKYLQMLANGFKGEGVNFDKGMIASLIVDEAGMFVNPNSNRTKLLRDLVKNITGDQNKGLVFTLNGELQSNSIMDIVYRLAYVNRDIMNAEDIIKKMYTESSQFGKEQLKGVKAAADVKKWAEEGIKLDESPEELVRRARNDFMSLAPNSEQLRMKDIADSGTVSRKKEVVLQTGQFAAVQSETYKKLMALDELSQKAKGNKEIKEIIQTYQVALLSLLIHSSMGAAHPRSMFEYSIGDGRLSSEYEKYLEKNYSALGFSNPEDAKQDFRNKLMEYLSLVSEDNQVVVSALGTVPKSSDSAIERNGEIIYMTTANRQALWEEIMGRHAEELSNVVMSWRDPASDEVANKVKTIFKTAPNRAVDSLNKKIVVAAPSKIAMKKLERILKSELGEGTLVQMIDGETPQEKREEIESTHRKTKIPVVTIVTNAGARGLNLQSGHMIRYPFWSIGQARQAEGRARRNPKQNLNLHVVVPGGGGEFMDDVLEGKMLSEEVMSEPTDDAIDDLLKFIIEKEEQFKDVSTLVAKLREYMKNVDASGA